MKKVLFLLLLLFAYSQNGYGQSDVYEELKAAYDQFRKEGKHESSLTAAKKMNAWALQFETDSSLRYAVSLRYVGISFISLSRTDSALYYWNKSLEVLEKQQRAESLDAASCQNFMLYDQHVTSYCPPLLYFCFVCPHNRTKFVK